jgi:PKD repeat protein
LWRLANIGWGNPSSKALGPYYWLQHRVSPNGYRYWIAKAAYTINAAAAPDVTFLQANFSGTTAPLEGSFLSDFGTIVAADAGVWKTFAFLSPGSTHTDIMFEPVGGLTPVEISTPAAGATAGFKVSLRKLVQHVGSADDKDIETKVDYIILGIPPEASFTADPTQGITSVNVQFENTSVEAVGLPTTWSWKSRLSGSGDPFVEFSTEKNPSKTFSK